MDESFPDPEVLSVAVQKALSRGGDFADVFAETVSRSRIVLSENQVKEIASSSDRGTGVRVVSGEATGYSFAESFEEEAVLRAAARASATAREGAPGQPAPLRAAEIQRAPALETPPGEVALEKKVALVRRVNEEARSAGDEVKNVQVVFMEYAQDWRLTGSGGVQAGDGRRLTDLVAVVTAVRDGNRRTGIESLGGPLSFEALDAKAEAIGREAAGMARRMLSAEPAPAGKMPVVLCNGTGGGGVLFHEACGHALESDAIVQGQSIFEGKRGSRVASPQVTLIDDGLEDGLSGTIRFDDEGTPAQKTVLIEGGTLEGYLCDLQGAGALGLAPTGNGRRQSFRFPPIPRMRNTYLAPGKATKEDLIGSVDRGVYVAQIGGGAGEMSGAGFVFSALESYLIENGKLGPPLTGVTLSGRGLDLLEGVEATAGDFAFSPGGGMCGKQGQWAFVSEGQATTLIRGLTVGGGRHGG